MFGPRQFHPATEVPTTVGTPLSKFCAGKRSWYGVTIMAIVSSLHITALAGVTVIADGDGLTVTTRVGVQPASNEYVIVAVPPDIPVTMPPEPTVAISGLLLDHAPPALASLREISDPIQTADGPVIAGGANITEKGVVTSPPHGSV